MAEATMLGSLRPISAGGSALNKAAWFCFSVAVFGQLLFAYYILVFYGTSAAHGHFKNWNNVLTHGIVKGDPIGNAAISLHLLLAFIITVGGPLQFIVQIRERAPAFHRWNGRAYASLTSTAAIAGLYMIWTRGTVGDTLAHVETSLDGTLIVVCAAMTVRYALARKFAAHRQWALRLFLVANGGWFFRVGLMLWLIVNKGPVGFNPDTFEGPFLSFLGLAEFAVPLAVLELYLRTQNGTSRLGKWTLAISLVGLTVALGVGIFGAFESMWLPNILHFG